MWRGLAAPDPRERGQALILMTISFLALLAFVGLVTDTGSLYNAFGQLRRAVDGAVLASAVQFRETGNVTVLTNIALETLRVNGIDDVTATVFTCDNNGDLLNDDPNEPGVGDDADPSDPVDPFTPALQNPPNNIDPQLFHDEFLAYCNPTGDDVSRKFVWVYAETQSPVYFLQLFGLSAVDLTAYAISEAATLDIVLVLDTSESMAIQPCDNPGDSDGNDPTQFDCVSGDDVLNQTYNSSETGLNEIPGADVGNYSKFCNGEQAVPTGSIDPDVDNDGINACYPFYLVKHAADGFIQKINFPYDRVAIVTFDGNRFDCPGSTNPCPLSTTGLAGDASLTFNNPPSARLNLLLQDSSTAAARAFVSQDPDGPDNILDNADDPLKVYFEDETYKGLFPEFDISGDGSVTFDDLSQFCSGDASAVPPIPGPAAYGEWDRTTGLPDPGVPNPFTDVQIADYVLAYCGASNVGGGMRVAGEHLRESGRPNSVWVIIFLTDGFTNLSDLPPIVDASYTHGFCQGPNTGSGQPDGWFMVRPLCTDNSILTRYCSDTGGATGCPPSYNIGPSYPTTVTYDDPAVLPNFYNVEDYARDQADAAALNVTLGTGSEYNSLEDVGGNAVIYTIALGTAITNVSANVADDDASLTSGVAMLRYFANVGDDGDRTNDPCYEPVSVAVNVDCGNYYFSPDAAGLAQVFDTIAEKVFFRISQ